MNPGAYRYALDPTGLNPDNLVIAEEHQTTANSVRAVAPNSGAFFAESMLVYDSDTNTQLTVGTDYKCVELLQDATLKYGKEICVLLLIINPAVSSSVTITYQAVGGQFQYDGSAIANLYETVIKDNRPVDWENVLNRPLEYPPTMHNHLLEDVYGFEPVVAAIERVRNAIVLSDVPAFEAVIDWMNERANQISTALNEQTTVVQGHNDARNNPHVVTKAQVGLSKVENNEVVSAVEIIDTTPTHKYVTHDRLISFSDWKLGNVEGKTVETFVKDHVSSVMGAHEAAADPHPQYMTADEVTISIGGHEAATDPHPQYMTSAEVGTTITAHEAATDPHPQYMTASEVTTSIGGHEAATDPHPQYATDADLTTAFTNHTTSADPHSQYLDKLTFTNKIGDLGSATVKEYVDSSTTAVTAESLGIHSYRVMSAGTGSTELDQQRCGLYKNGAKVFGAVRSYMVVALSKSTGQITFRQSYDVFGDGERTEGRNAQTMAVDLNTLSADVVVVVYTLREPKTNRLTSGLDQAMYRCGASRAVFGSSAFAFRGAYVLIGVPGCGEGNGSEFYRGIEYTDPITGFEGDPNALVEIGFQISEGEIVGVGGVGSQFFGYVDRDTFQQKLSGITTTTLKEYIDDTTGQKEPTIAPSSISDYYRGDKSWQTLNKAAVGLSNVNNTSDANKPISTATQEALNNKENTGIAASLVSVHEASTDPHPQYATDANLTTGLSGKEDVGTASGLLGAHESATDPHPQYNPPPGAVCMFYANTPPSGWLEANGAWHSKTTYPRLYNQIKDITGILTNGDLFTVPDLRGEFLRGWDNGRGVDAGRALGSSQLDMFSSHLHRLKTDTGIVSQGNEVGLTDTGIWTDVGGPESLNSAAISSDGQHIEATTYTEGGVETRPRNVALLVCISY